MDSAPVPARIDSIVLHVERVQGWASVCAVACMYACMRWVLPRSLLPFFAEWRNAVFNFQQQLGSSSSSQSSIMPYSTLYDTNKH